jgi:hypothetical protein
VGREIIISRVVLKCIVYWQGDVGVPCPSVEYNNCTLYNISWYCLTLIIIDVLRYNIGIRVYVLYQVYVVRVLL